ncbi:unnamed protein product, partial [Laminaria digitata]
LETDFLQTPLGDGPKQILVEASPYDNVWGIGFRTEDPPIYQLSL